MVEKGFRIARSMSEVELQSDSLFHKPLIFLTFFQEGKSWVTTGIVLPSKVVSLVIRRPPHFTFKPGDYIFVNIPAIASFEWHPFTISSAPEQVGLQIFLWAIFFHVKYSFIIIDKWNFTSHSCCRSMDEQTLWIFWGRTKATWMHDARRILSGDLLTMVAWPAYERIRQI